MEVNKYTNLENWYDASKVNFGQIGGVEIDQKSDSIVVFHRGEQVWLADSFNSDNQFNIRKYELIPTNTVVVMNRNTGNVINSWGANMFYMPHGLKIDSEGNTWITDVALHQVMKFSPGNYAKPALTVGEALVPGNDQYHFCQPADIAVLKNGDFFVADGYCNSRIMKYNRRGEFLSEWSSDDDKMPRHFFLPHSLALHEAQNLLCVADRENYRVQCFDLNGNFIHESNMAEQGPVYGVAFAARNASILYAVNGLNSRTKTQQYDKKIFLLSVRTGNLIGAIDLVRGVKTPHDIAVSDDAAEIYIANLNPPQVFKYVYVNYKLGSIGGSGGGGGAGNRFGNGSSYKGAKQSDAEQDNLRTSMFIMGFLAVPLIVIVCVALLVRIKNSRRLAKKANIISFMNTEGSEAGGAGAATSKKETKFSKWISRKTNKNKRNGFMRVNSDDNDDEERVHLNQGPGSDSDDNETSHEEVEIGVPKLSKA
jgi:hypothetical protein